ncbi:C-terminal binding protein [Paenibacillus radicis (ex Xue et al. 2023)]|uniref:C-terminal binding protein n=1 Tax=Paenibacillus radicis (ex Xue et al. 2023) TaxID=2972489 RepID=A0ABT1YQ59_9BACL|nr:C-terminal binding protein [Paenibacillus radicis (ex Xue et al. 2023)]MCR8635317.1 C-terminal binding protein [Paenibacillus radicis (ex Xue et al. 2023)]
MAKYRVVITDYEYKSLQIEQDVLAQLDVEFVTSAQCRTEEEVIELARDADAILNQYAPISARVIQNLNNCKVISRYGVGVNTIDLDAATHKGIVVANCTDYCIDEVADHALALLLASARKVSLLDAYVKQGVWEYKKAIPIYRLREKVLGLVGFGKIPQNLCLKAKALGLRVQAYDPFITSEIASQYEVELVDLDTLCQSSDFISVHVPLNPRTQGLISTKQFSLMKREAIIINTSRGPLIDEQAMITALQNSHIAGAALDVLEYEPIRPDNPLLQMEQVILNPHVAWYSEESEQELKGKVAQNIVDVLSGFYPQYLANSQVKNSAALKERSARL